MSTLPDQKEGFRQTMNNKELKQYGSMSDSNCNMVEKQHSEAITFLGSYKPQVGGR